MALMLVTRISHLVRRFGTSRFFLLGLLACSGAVLWPAAADDRVDFASEIAPILSRHCLTCHNRERTEGRLSLVSLADLARPKTPKNVVVASDPDSSLLIQMVSSSALGERPEMPREGSPLTAEQVALLRAWVKQGAEWPEELELQSAARADLTWWSLQPLSGSAPPAVEPSLRSRVRNGVDAFVVQQLAERQLPSSPVADKRTLIRRLSFVLHGLPPEPEEIAEFLADSRPGAWERLVDRYLASPRYGERWGRHWLDVIRFGESNGYERNVIRNNAWYFRDYVIDSLNRDKPYDRFVQEHLAGDRLGSNEPEVEVGTAFLVGGAYDDVGNQDPAAALQIRANTIDDMINASASAFLGLTVSCARCHDHKFDPIPQADYYRFQSAFAGVQQGARILASAEERNRYEREREPLAESLEQVRQTIEQVREGVRKRVERRKPELTKQFNRPKVDPYGTEERFEPVVAKAVRLEINGTTQGRYHRPVIDEFEVWTPEPDSRNVALASYGSKATANSMRYSNDDPLLYSALKTNDGGYGEYWIANLAGGVLTVEFPRLETVSRVIWSNDRVRAFSRNRSRPFSTDYTISVSVDGEEWTPVASSQGREPFNESLLNDKLFAQVVNQEENKRLGELDKRRRELERQLNAVKGLPQAWVGNFQQPAKATYLMQGGDPTRVGAEIPPSSLKVLEQLYPGYRLDPNAPEGERRLELARWLTDRRNPLFSRVMVNRLWHYHFGRGIVATPSDFGAGGSEPTYPALLDWMAGELIRHEWRLKPIHRLILNSHTWRQASDARPEGVNRDRDAVYLWRYPPRRLEAEAIRDAILRITGSLNTAMGGPGFRLYRYSLDNVATYYPLDEYDPSTFRRSVYHQHVRAAQVDLLTDFDCPDPALPAPSRTATISPQQAMSLQNHPFVIQQAKALAERLAERHPGGSVADQVTTAYRLCFAREPEADELSAAVALVRSHGLPLFCRALINANEFIYLR